MSSAFGDCGVGFERSENECLGRNGYCRVVECPECDRQNTPTPAVKLMLCKYDTNATKLARPIFLENRR